MLSINGELTFIYLVMDLLIIVVASYLPDSCVCFRLLGALLLDDDDAFCSSSKPLPDEASLARTINHTQNNYHDSLSPETRFDSELFASFPRSPDRRTGTDYWPRALGRARFRKHGVAEERLRQDSTHNSWNMFPGHFFASLPLTGTYLGH